MPQDGSTPAASQTPAIQPAKSAPRNPVLEAQIEKLDEDIKEQTKLLPPLQERMDFHTEKLANEPVFEQKIARLEQDYESLKKEYTGLVEKKQSAELSYALEVHQKAEKFIVLDAAQTPLRPSSPNRPLIAMAGLLGGLFIGVALAAGVEMSDETVRSEGDLARILGKPVLSGVPWLVSVQERRASWLRAAGVLACTLLGSLALGFFVSFVTGRFF